MRYHLAGDDGKAVCCVGKMYPNAPNVLVLSQFLTIDVEHQCKTCRKAWRNLEKTLKIRHAMDDRTGSPVCGRLPNHSLTPVKLCVSVDDFVRLPEALRCKTCQRMLGVVHVDKKKTYSYVGVMRLRRQQRHLPGASGMRGLCGKVTANVVPREEFFDLEPYQQCPKCAAQDHDA